MRYATVCSGIEAPSVAWHQLGWTPVFFSEIEPFPSQVLSHYYPDVPNLGDMEKINGTEYNGAVDIICGGTPCQSFSVAGLRAGMRDPRGNLALVFVRLLDQIRPEWFIWENVPGVLSSNGGRDFSSFLGALGGIGYGCAYRVLDAQYFGVPQRRRRVFVVGHISGDPRRAAEILFDSTCLSGDSGPSREEKTTASALTASRFGGGGADDNAAQAGRLIAATLCANGKGSGYANVQDAENLIHIRMATGQASAEILAGQSPTLTCAHEQPIAFVGKAGGAARSMGEGEICPTLDASVPAVNVCHPFVFQPAIARNGRGVPDTIASALTANAGETGKGDRAQCVVNDTAVRRLMPIEYERLQGFPDNYTLISSKTKDAPRYKALGNSMAVPVMRWIGERINRSKQCHT